MEQLVGFGYCSEKVLDTKLSTIGNAIKNLGLFSKSPGDLRIEKMDF